MADNRDGLRTQRIRKHGDLEVYRKAFDVAMRIFELSKTFPSEEKYSLTDQIRRSSRSVCANLAKAWRKRRYEGAFITARPSGRNQKQKNAGNNPGFLSRGERTEVNR